MRIPKWLTTTSVIPPHVPAPWDRLPPERTPEDVSQADGVAATPAKDGAGKPPEADSSRGGCFQSSWWMAMMVAAAIAHSHNRGNRPHPRQYRPPYGSPTRSDCDYRSPNGLLQSPLPTGLEPSRGSRSETHWQQTVESLHRFRFEPPAPSDEPARAYYRRRYAGFQTAVQQAEAASGSDVDADLAAMVRRHFQLDHRELKLFETGQRWFAAENPRGESNSLAENLQLIEPGLELFSNMSDEEFARLPAELQQIISDTFDLLEKREAQLREIELMQARLNGRYGLPFPLPELQQEKDVDQETSPDITY